MRKISHKLLLVYLVSSAGWLSAAQAQLLDALRLAELLPQFPAQVQQRFVQRQAVQHHVRPQQIVQPAINPDQLARDWVQANQQIIMHNIQEVVARANFDNPDELHDEFLLGEHDPVNVWIRHYHLPPLNAQASRQVAKELINLMIRREFDRAFAQYLQDLVNDPGHRVVRELDQLNLRLDRGEGLTVEQADQYKQLAEQAGLQHTDRYKRIAYWYWKSQVERAFAPVGGVVNVGYRDPQIVVDQLRQRIVDGQGLSTAQVHELQESLKDLHRNYAGYHGQRFDDFDHDPLGDQVIDYGADTALYQQLRAWTAANIGRPDARFPDFGAAQRGEGKALPKVAKDVTRFFDREVTDQSECPICRGELIDTDEGLAASRATWASLQPCRHIMHRECYNQMHAAGRNTCPECRANIIGFRTAADPGADD